MPRVKLKSVCVLLALCHAGSAVALGLGDIQVRSALGQPFHATIVVIDPVPGADASCFSLDSGNGNIAPPPRMRLSLDQAGGQTVLRLRTTQSVHEPIVQFQVASDCEARLQREYVVLLDPPSASELSGNAGLSDQPADPVSVAGAETAAVETAAPKMAPPPRVRARPQRARPVTARAGSAPATPAPRKITVPSDKPRLVLSGKSGSGGGDLPMALKYDQRLPDPDQARSVGVDTTELSDENTALNRKLAYLESQLLALQKRNAELDARLSQTRSSSAIKPPDTAPGQPPQWPFYLLLTGLLVSGGLLAVWLRNRTRPPEPVSVPSPTLPQPSSRLAMGRPETDTPAKFARMPESEAPMSVEATEVKDDVLDQAEVYLAHGHSDLAIHMLQEHLRAEPNESPIPWLLLLDLLHRAGDHEGYAAASTECRRYFNVNLGSHPLSQPGGEDQGLEAYPHLMEQLVKIWNLPDRENFFDGLIHDDRGGTRIGFEQGAYRDILLLRAIALDTEPPFI